MSRKRVREDPELFRRWWGVGVGLPFVAGAALMKGYTQPIDCPSVSVNIDLEMPLVFTLLNIHHCCHWKYVSLC